jgi:hypothetical protein
MSYSPSLPVVHWIGDQHKETMWKLRPPLIPGRHPAALRHMGTLYYGHNLDILRRYPPISG